MPTQSTLAIFKDPLPIPPTIFPPATPDPTIFIKMKLGSASLHSDLPPTPIWGYGGRYPGVTIEVNQGQTIHVLWKNRLTKTNATEADVPFRVVTSQENTQSEAGVDEPNSFIDPDIPKIRPYTVVHLHGAKTHADSDGWTDNAVFVNQSLLYTYENNDRATMFWYHDHAMGVTRLNVYAGLAGIYIVRDAEESGLHLPSGKYEIPLLLQDRNLETTAAGNLTGKLLHKVEGRKFTYPDPKNGSTTIAVQDGTMEFFGPFNLVNGKITPFLEVERAVYRFRIVNGSNARTYKLGLFEEGSTTPFVGNVFKQIGSDGGLFRKAEDLPDNKLTLASGERADLIADFRAANLKGKKLNWVNTALSPFDGGEVNFLGLDYKHLDNGLTEPNEFLPNTQTPNPNYNPSLALRQTNASVMQFIIGKESTATNNFTMPTILSGSFVRTTHTNLPAEHNHRFIALVEEEREFADSNGDPINDTDYKPKKPHDPLQKNLAEPMLMLRELEETTQTIYDNLLLTEQFRLRCIDLSGETNNIKFYQSVASMFYDQINFKIAFDSTEVWKIINLTGDTHPFHVHLVQFQSLGRRTIVEDIANLNTDGYPVSEIDTGLSHRRFRELNSVGAENFDITFNPVIDPNKPHNNLLDENEKGWKDTIRVNPGNVMSIAMKFDGHCGRYMYHCHLLEHEDKEMMRPFVVLPDAIIDRMRMSGGHHH